MPSERGMGENGFWFIECDIDGHGKRWRLARVYEVAGLAESYFVASFIDGSDFDEQLNVYLENGSRMVGPLTVNNLLACVSAGEYLLDVEGWFLSQKTPGEARIMATKANGLQSACIQIAYTDPKWKRINFASPITRFEGRNTQP